MDSRGSTIRYVSPIVVLLGTVLTGAGLTGCSFIGYAIGSGIDSGTPIDSVKWVLYLASDTFRILLPPFFPNSLSSLPKNKRM